MPRLLRWKLLQFVGAVLIAVACIGLLLVWSGSFQEYFGWRLLGLLLAVVVGFAGVKAYQFGQGHSARSAAAVTREDRRPPVVYLRSFQDDPVAAKGFAPQLVMSFLEFVNTEEEQLTEVLSEIGPFIAIGRPGERLPTIGASRMYVTDAEWRARVLELMSAARLVTIRAGSTQGIWWEIETAVRTLQPEKLVFLLPYTKAQYEVFRQKAESYLPCRLPDYISPEIAIGSLRGILYFGPGWKPHYGAIKKLRVGSWKPMARIYKYTFAPVFKQLNVKWKPPGNWHLLLLAVLVFVVPFVAMYILFLLMKLLRLLGVHL